MIRTHNQGLIKKGTQKGFSLIELAILMAITGLLVASALSTYDSYTKRKAYNSTIEKRNNIQIAFGRFKSEYGRLPCPADPSLPVSHPDAGKENCRPGGVAYPTLSPSGCVGHCRIAGARRQFGTLPSGTYPTNGVPVPPGVEYDRLLRGVVPYKTLGLALREAYDGWGTMMTYVVTELLASSYLLSNDQVPPYGKIKYQERYGAISLLVWDKEDGADESVPYNVDQDTPELDGWPFVVVSHGPDTKGGWTINGTVAVPCSGVGRDIPNCDPESAAFVEPTYMVMVQGPLFYDDPMLMTDYVTEADKWYYTGVKTIQNKGGRVGINTENPAHPLDVAGEMRSEKARVHQYCDTNGEKCFNSSLVGSSLGIDCAHSPMLGIINNGPSCDPKLNLGSITVGNCPPNHYLVGFCADGSKMCRAFGGPQPTCD